MTIEEGESDRSVAASNSARPPKMRGRDSWIKGHS